MPDSGGWPGSSTLMRTLFCSRNSTQEPRIRQRCNAGADLERAQGWPSPGNMDESVSEVTAVHRQATRQTGPFNDGSPPAEPTRISRSTSGEISTTYTREVAVRYGALGAPGVTPRPQTADCTPSAPPRASVRSTLAQGSRTSKQNETRRSLSRPPPSLATVRDHRRRTLKRFAPPSKTEPRLAAQAACE